MEYRVVPQFVWMCLEIFPSVKRHISFAEITNSPVRAEQRKLLCLYSEFQGVISISVCICSILL